MAEFDAILGEPKPAGRAVLLVEQNVTPALTVCDRFVAMERGRVALEGQAGVKADCDRLLSIIAV